uniref:Glyco_transf_7C domain-containing protein n=1 Tax=Caenorhabditis tropicalis TaxID=1561998 RepID=A0A1I7TGF0_9PELO
MMSSTYGIYRHKKTISFLTLFIFAFTIFEYLSKPVIDYSENLYHIPYPIIKRSEYPVNVSSENIALVFVLSEGLNRDYYKLALDSVECYAKAHGYQFVLTDDSNWGCDYLKDGTGHIRDTWLTSGVWSPERDFMIHGWKTPKLAEVPEGRIFPIQMSNTKWYSPFSGDFDLEKCGLGNTTWNYNEKLIGSREDVEYGLRKYEMNRAMKKIELLRGLYDLIENRAYFFRWFFHPKKSSLFLW